VPASFCPAQGDPAEVSFRWQTIKRRDNAKQPIAKAIQYLLRAHGHNLMVDSVFGNQTAWEIKKFQRRHGLQETGVVDHNTWDALVIPVKAGSRGDAVRAAQSRLQSHGYDICEDGVFGTQTQKTVGLFQSSPNPSNMFVNGIVDKRTWCFLIGGYVAP
jgi:peptidoglycan hydrolase-like protein with peptidoglycan-binding domain